MQTHLDWVYNSGMVERDLPDNSVIKSYISKAENLEILEHVLRNTNALYISLCKQQAEGGFSYGEEITKEGLAQLFPEVAGATNSFLGVEEASPVEVFLYNPNIVKRLLIGNAGLVLFTALTAQKPEQVVLTAGIGTFVLALSRIPAINHRLKLFFKENTRTEYGDSKISIADRWTSEVVGSLAHEYTHHLQNSYGVLKYRNALSEGHAFGVEHNIARIYTERYQNPAYMLHTLNSLAPHLKHGYVDCSRLAGKSPPFLEQISIPDPGKLFAHEHHYCLGVAAMSVAEAKNGTSVYRDVLTRNFNFLKH